MEGPRPGGAPDGGDEGWGVERVMPRVMSWGAGDDACHLVVLFAFSVLISTLAWGAWRGEGLEVCFHADCMRKCLQTVGVILVQV